MNSRIGLLVALVSTASYPNVVLTFGSDKEAQVPHALTPSAFEIGGSLVANCRHGEPQTHYCIGYVVGIIDMAKLLYLSSGDEGMRFCLDGSLTLAQVANRVVDEIARNQDALHASAAIGVVEALRIIHPCP